MDAMNAPEHHSAPQYAVGVGAIAGDIIDSIHEFGPPAPPDVPQFQPHIHITDDTLLTLATAERLATRGDYAQAYRAAYRRHPAQGWGGMFREWARSDSPEPYNSYGNGSAKRVSPVAVWAESEQELLAEARRSAEVTHTTTPRAPKALRPRHWPSGSPCVGTHPTPSANASKTTSATTSPAPRRNGPQVPDSTRPARGLCHRP